jgi:hypothetical protein
MYTINKSLHGRIRFEILWQIKPLEVKSASAAACGFIELVHVTEFTIIWSAGSSAQRQKIES